MALPKLNALPKYECILPSKNKSIRFRPFLVKEQKVLLIAMESQNPKVISNAVSDIINDCIDSSIPLSQMTSYDIEYLFTQIRSKSVGENVELNLNCQDETCGEPTPVGINLEDITVGEVTETSRVIQLTDEVDIVVQHPTFGRLNQVPEANSETENMIELLMTSIESVVTEEENILFKDHSHEEQLEFIDSLSSEQLAKVIEFLSDIPTLSYDLEWKCNSCGKDNTLTLRGLNDFFS